MGFLSSIGDAIGLSGAESDLRDARRDYTSSTNNNIAEFMKSWGGEPPAGYSDWNEVFFGRDIEQKLKKDLGLTKSQKKTLKGLDLIEEQEAYLTDLLGREVKLAEKYTKGKKVTEQGPGMEGMEGKYPTTFEELNALRDQGYTPSKEMSLTPYIKPGQEAFTTLANTINTGDMSKFYTSPDYQYRLGESEKAINRLQSANRLPTAGAHDALVKKAGSLASGELSTWRSALGGLSDFSYGVLQDLYGLESYYKGTELGQKNAQAASIYNMQGDEAALRANQWSSVGSGLDSILSSNSGENGDNSSYSLSNVMKIFGLGG